jgi:tRNA-2-methylthio-N6-dimethylallyladenosine synthase
MLLGQNVNSYRFIDKNSSAEASAKVDKFITFPKLLQKINSIPGNFWIRFLTSHPKDMSDELIETIAKGEKVCEYVHLPIQAGDDEILRRMNRKYTAKQYLGLIKKIKKAFAKFKPGILYSITSDVIVGFPGETKKQLLKSAEIMKKVEYDMVYFGQYSPRPGTVAWKLKDNVSKKEKERREKYLNEIIKKTSLENNKKYLGKIVDVLVTHYKSKNNTGNLSRERLPKKNSSVIKYFGKTRTMKNVKFGSNKKNLVGKFVKVKITKANAWNLEGVLQKS